MLAGDEGSRQDEAQEETTNFLRQLGSRVQSVVAPSPVRGRRGITTITARRKSGPCPTKHYLREEKILEQARKIVEQLSLPDEWADNMLRELDKQEVRSKSEHRAARSAPEE